VDAKEFAICVLNKKLMQHFLQMVPHIVPPGFSVNAAVKVNKITATHPCRDHG